MLSLDQGNVRCSAMGEWPNVPPGGFFETHYTIEYDMTNITMAPSDWFQMQVLDENLSKLPGIVCSRKISTFEHELIIDRMDQSCLEHKELDPKLVKQLHQEKQLVVRVSLFQSGKLGEFLIEFQKRRGDSCLFGHYYRQYFATLATKLNEIDQLGVELSRPKNLELGELGNMTLCF